MKRALSLIVFMVFVPAMTSRAAGEDASGQKQTVESLRAQLQDTQAREAELQERARQLDENLKPENIERSLAGVGSTKPEELRELRRRQLTIERDGVRAQLKLIATSRERLESAIRTAETAAYQQGAEGPTAQSGQMLTAGYGASPRWMAGIVGALIAILGIVLVIVFVRRP